MACLWRGVWYYEALNDLGEVVCKLLIDSDPAIRVLVQSIAWCTTALQLFMVFWTSHDVYRQWLAYQQKHVTRFFTSPALWCQCYSMICGTLMAVAYIDFWGMMDIYKSGEYLGMYALPYGGLAACIVGFGAYIIDIAIWKGVHNDTNTKPIPAIGALVLMALVFLYSAVGFPIFGWVLASDFKKNINTPLGPIGNILAYTMYGLIILVCLIVIVGTIIVMNRRFGDHLPDESALIQNRITSWAFWNILGCSVFLGVSMSRQYYYKDESLLGGTLILLGTNRLLELWMQYQVNTYQDTIFCERFKFSCYIDLILRRPTVLSARGAVKRYTGTSATNLSSMTRSKNTSSSRGDTTDRDGTLDSDV